MSQKVPEDQMEFLTNKLIGNEAFGRLRGRWLARRKLGALGLLLDEAVSPSDFCRNWDQFSSDTRVIGNLLARFRRDGWSEAESELTRALRDSAYRLPGETVPLNETEPVTIVVFDFPLTLTMIRWIKCARWTDLEAFTHENDGKQVFRWGKLVKYVWEEPSRTLTHELFEAFPNLLDGMRSCLAFQYNEGRALVQAYQHCVPSHFRDKQFYDVEQLYIDMGRNNEYLKVSDCGFGCLVREDQGNVLSRFTREEQERISTWMIRLPKVISAEAFAEKPKRHLVVEFHPESTRKKRRNEPNAFVSLGCSQGYETVVLDSEYARVVKDRKIQLHIKDPHTPIAFELRPAY